MIDALRMQIEDLEHEIPEHEDLKEGRLLSFGADDLYSLGELLTRRALNGVPGSGYSSRNYPQRRDDREEDYYAERSPESCPL